MDEDDENVQTAVFGKMVEDFLDSEVGRFILNCAESDAGEATILLKSANPEDSSLIRKLQNDIARAESVKGWLVKAIITGQQALAIIEGKDD